MALTTDQHLTLLQTTVMDLQQRLANLEFRVNTHLSPPPYAASPYSPNSDEIPF